MSTRALLLLLATSLFCSTAYSDDLYRVSVQSKAEAERLTAAYIDPVLRVRDGYLVLVDNISVSRLESAGLQTVLLATGVRRDLLAVDARRDDRNVGIYPMLYEDGRLRLYHVTIDDLMAKPVELFPIGSRSPKITFRAPRPPITGEAYQETDLDSLISLVNRDSLESYTERLQAFYRRTAGTDSNYVSRDWIAAKLTSFGYDSVVIDSFVESIGGSPTECQNVIAYKIGSRFPGLHVIVGAHRDAVSNSPGANDNGSGTAGVLEIARVLKNIETDMSFVLVLFDAEEYGLYGAWHYVNEAMSRGDSIMYMLNMDMIGHYENESEACLYYGSDATYSELWQSLADSLLDVMGHLCGGSGGSDHYPFAQNGYDVTFVAEWIFSPFWHTPQDSTTNMDFDYMTKLVKASLATAYVVNSTVGPRAVAFEYPGGVPALVTPGVPTTFEVMADSGWLGEPVPGTGQLHYAADGGSLTTVAMAELSPNHYEATLPAIACDSRYEFYVSAEELLGGRFYSPDTNNPFTAVSATVLTVQFEDDFETDQGWTVSGDAVRGHWERGIPVDAGQGDPLNDFDGSGKCYVTGNGMLDSDVDSGSTLLTSPVFDISTGDARIQYARWFSNYPDPGPASIEFKVCISNDNGVSWAVAEALGQPERTGSWNEHSFRVSDFVTPTSQMRLRFEASDSGMDSRVEAAVDAIEIVYFECGVGPLDTDNDSIPDETDNCPLAYNPDQADADGDSIGDSCDVCTDTDGDGYGNPGYPADTCQPDNCPFVYNPDQADADSNSVGNACCCVTLAGNADCDTGETVDISDLTAVIDYLFISSQPLCCPDAANTDGDEAGVTDISDVTRLIDYLFISNTPPAECP